mgnify:CR=1 FL=1
MTHGFGIEATWLDDDRMGAMLEGLADHHLNQLSDIEYKASNAQSHTETLQERMPGHRRI